MAAPTTVQTVAGTLLAMSANQPATQDVAGYGATAMAYTAVGEVEDLGTYGAVYTKVTHQPIATRTIAKRKGSVDYGKITFKVGRIPSDAGQVIALAASGSDVSYAFKITYPLAGGTTSEIHYFQGQVMSYQIINGTVDNIQKAQFDVEVTSILVIKAAT